LTITTRKNVASGMPYQNLVVVKVMLGIARMIRRTV
jgi:hypothetical protein